MNAYLGDNLTIALILHARKASLHRRQYITMPRVSSPIFIAFVDIHIIRYIYISKCIKHNYEMPKKANI